MRVAVTLIVAAICVPAPTALTTGLKTHRIENTEYYWPSGRGYTGMSSVGGATLAQAPFDLKGSLAWTWHGSPRYAMVPNGANIDEHKNIYLTTYDGIRKFSEDGDLLWEYTKRDVGGVMGEEFPEQASLYKGALYVSTTRGRVLALSMDTGKVIFETKLKNTDPNNGWVSVSEDTIIVGSDASPRIRNKMDITHYGDQRVTGLNASDGRILWQFSPEAPVWNFQGSFVGDGTFIFQDYEGRAYRNRVSDGSNIWTKGGFIGSWTDGSAMLGPNHIFYTVNNRNKLGGKNAPGDLCAWKVDDGELLWKVEVPRPPNGVPAIGRLFGREGLSVVQPIGQQVMHGAPTDVYAFDAQTGEVQWIFRGPAQKGLLQKGDDNLVAIMQRSAGRVRPITLPNGWSAPSIDGSGTVFIGNQEGPMYALRDADGDGNVEGEGEVSTMDAKACFSGSGSPAIAPGMVVFASQDQMYVFKQ